jgi:hypothetical protein
MPTEDTTGERLLTHSLNQRGLSYEREPSVGGRNPDFLIDTPQGRVVAEVYEPRLVLPRRGRFLRLDHVDHESLQGPQAKAAEGGGDALRIRRRVGQGHDPLQRVLRLGRNVWA